VDANKRNNASSWSNDPELGPVFHDLLQLREGGFNSMAALEKLSGQRPESGALAWQVLIGMEGLDNPGICCRLYRLLHRLRPDFESYVETEWPRLAEQSRVNVAYSATSSELMSLELALRLYHHPNSALHEKRVLIAGLTVSAHQRDAISRILPVVNEFSKFAQLHGNQKNVKLADRWMQELQRIQRDGKPKLVALPLVDDVAKWKRVKTAKQTTHKPSIAYYTGGALAFLGLLCLPVAILTMIIGFWKASDEGASAQQLARFVAVAISICLAGLLLFAIGLILLNFSKPSGDTAEIRH
jgi:hypothetical protein